MFWNISPKQYQLKCFNNFCTKHLRAATSMMNCAFSKNIKTNKRNTIYLYKGLFIWEKLSCLIFTNKKVQFIWAERFPAWPRSCFQLTEISVKRGNIFSCECIFPAERDDDLVSTTQAQRNIKEFKMAHEEATSATSTWKKVRKEFSMGKKARRRFDKMYYIIQNKNDLSWPRLWWR